jgi:hypothetical protein
MEYFDQNRLEKDRPEEEDGFDQELRSALRRKTPSANFGARVRERVARAGDRRFWWRLILTWPHVRWAAVCVLVLGGVTYRQEQKMQRARGEAAKQQVMIALRIAGAQMKIARIKVQSLSQR